MTRLPDDDSFAGIRSELQLHDRAMSATSCGITIADATNSELPLIYINEGFTRITGYSMQESVGRNCRFLQRDDRDQPGLISLRGALKTGSDCTIVLRNYRKDGTLFWNELFTSPIYDADGRLTHFVGIQTDVTRRIEDEAALRQERDSLEKTLAQLRHTQAMLIQSEKMSALGQLVAGVAHEINNPISFVNSNLHSLRQTIEDIFDTYSHLETLVSSGEVTLEQIQAIREEGELDFIRDDIADLLRASVAGLGRVRKIVEGLRTFSRLDEAERKRANLQENLESTLMLAAVELRNRIEVVVELDNLPEIWCYPAELNQVFLNIIMNAAQAITGEGRLTIRGYSEDDKVVLKFTDTGMGIEPEIQKHIFEPFFTTKPVGQGTGLGLAIAYQIITEHHRGTISVESTPGIGTTFTTTLPKG